MFLAVSDIAPQQPTLLARVVHWQL
jgi:hypothetical protein